MYNLSLQIYLQITKMILIQVHPVGLFWISLCQQHTFYILVFKLHFQHVCSQDDIFKFPAFKHSFSSTTSVSWTSLMKIIWDRQIIQNCPILTTFNLLSIA